MKTGKKVSVGIEMFDLRFKYSSPCDEIEDADLSRIKTVEVSEGHIHETDLTRQLQGIVLKSSKDSCIKSYNDLSLHTVSGLPTQANSRNKRGFSDWLEAGVASIAGEIFGISDSNLVHTIWQHLDPNSILNRVSRVEKNVQLEHEMIQSVKTDFNISRKIELKILEQLNSLGNALISQEQQIYELAKILPTIDWVNGYIQNGIIRATNLLSTILSVKKHSRQVATTELGKLLNTTLLENIEQSDTYLEGIYHVNETIIFKFYARRYSTDTEVVAVKNFKYWSNILERRPSFNTYTGPSLAVYNSSNNCATGLQGELPRVVTQTCEDENHMDPTLNKWNKTALDLRSSKVDIQVEQDFSAFYIYCWPFKVSINNTAEVDCPPYPFNISNRIPFSIGGRIRHSANANVVRFDQEFNYPVKSSHLMKFDTGEKEYHLSDLLKENHKLSDELSHYETKTFPQLLDAMESPWSATLIAIGVVLFAISCLCTFFYLRSWYTYIK